MKIIALRGRSNCGKSETLGIFLRKLIYLQMSVQPEKKVWKDTRESIKVGNMTIDICPPGDTEEIVRENIAYFEKHPCDIAFTATRSRGRGCWALDGYANEAGAELIWIRKEYNDDLGKEGQEDANNALAEKLYRMI